MSKAIQRALARAYKHELGERPVYEYMSRKIYDREIERLLILWRHYRSGKVLRIDAKVSGGIFVSNILHRAARLMGE